MVKWEKTLIQWKERILWLFNFFPDIFLNSRLLLIRMKTCRTFPGCNNLVIYSYHFPTESFASNLEPTVNLFLPLFNTWDGSALFLFLFGPPIDFPCKHKIKSIAIYTVTWGDLHQKGPGDLHQHKNWFYSSHINFSLLWYP